MPVQLTLDEFEIWDGRDYQPAQQVIVSLGFDPALTAVSRECEHLIFIQNGNRPDSFRTTSWRPIKVK